MRQVRKQIAVDAACRAEASRRRDTLEGAVLVGQRRRLIERDQVGEELRLMSLEAERGTEARHRVGAEVALALDHELQEVGRT